MYPYQPERLPIYFSKTQSMGRRIRESGEARIIRTNRSIIAWSAYSPIKGLFLWSFFLYNDVI